MIVGEPKAGKTSLMKKMVNPKYKIPNLDDLDTLGINVHEGWKFKCLKEEIDFTANIWDFGGQEIQYATHQFFLTTNSLYVLVVDARKQATHYEYWLKVINLLGGCSPVVVFLNEKQGKPVSDFDLSHFRKQFQGKLQITLMEADLSIDTDGRIDNLRAQIQQQLCSLEHVGEMVPRQWDEIREDIQSQRAKNHLSYAEFEQICRQHGLDTPTSIATMARYLTILGTIIHFEDDPVLHDFLIINPQWAVSGIYKAFDRESLQDTGGRLARDTFIEVLLAEGYSRP